MAICEPLGVEGTMNWLLDYDQIVEPFPIAVWEACGEPGGRVFIEQSRIALWWALRMLLTHRPLEQRMLFFWHSHFAVGGSKIGFVPSLYSYLETLRHGAIGNFGALLSAVSCDPAMLVYLDGATSEKARPNENFARELLELFTMGQGKYSEQDIRELARCMTGMRQRPLVAEPIMGYATPELMDAMTNGKPMVEYYFDAAEHDPETKTFLGFTGKFGPNEAIARLACHKETARYMCRKLWRNFAYEAVPPKVEESLVKTFLETGGSIRDVLRAITQQAEFWSDACVRQMVKSPLDFVIPPLRQLVDDDAVKRTYKAAPSITVPLYDDIRNVGYLAYASMERQGMRLLDPPDVSGWKVGRSWVAPGNVMHRIRFANYIFAPGAETLPFCSRIVSRIVARKPKTVEHVTIELTRMLNADVSEKSKWVIMRCCSKAGGVKALKDPERASYMLTLMGRLIFASPEYQFC